MTTLSERYREIADQEREQLAQTRAVWWRIRTTGQHLPPQRGVIVIRGGRPDPVDDLGRSFRRAFDRHKGDPA